MSKTIEVIAKTAGKGKGFFGFFGGKLFLLKWFFIWLFVITILLHGIVESVNQKSPFPLIYEAVGTGLSADESIYQDLLRLEAEGIAVYGQVDGDDWGSKTKRFFAKSSFWWVIFSKLMIIYFMFTWVNRLWLTNDDSKKTKAFLKTILTLVILQMLLGAVFTIDHLVTDDGFIPKDELMKLEPYQRWISEFKYILPFKGISKLVLKIATEPDFLLNPTYNIVKKME